MSERQDFFGSGLRAHLERSSGEPDAGGEPPAADAPPAPPPRPPTLEEREQAQLDRERRFEEHVQAFEAHAAALAKHEESIRERERALEQTVVEGTEQRRAVRDVLREHAELSIARVLQVFDDGLTATHGNGAPDHAVRLAAVRVLLGEAYATGESGTTAAAIDELAALRQRRTADTPGF